MRCPSSCKLGRIYRERRVCWNAVLLRFLWSYGRNQREIKEKSAEVSILVKAIVVNGIQGTQLFEITDRTSIEGEALAPEGIYIVS